MKHLFIVNPTSGKKKRTAQFLASIEEAMAGYDYEVALTQRAGDAERLAREAAGRGEEMRIYACGGDGTLYEVVNGAAGYGHVAITNVPKGTGNDFLRIFGAGARERFSDLKALANGPQAAFDLMDCNGRLGIGVICAGLDARVAADVHHYKGLPFVTGIGAYILSLIVNVFRGLTKPMKICLASRTFDGETAILCICNGRYYGGGFMPVGDAEPDDGILDTLVVGKVGLLTFLRLVGKYAAGRYREYPDMISDAHVDALSFSSPEEIPVVIDGEVLRGREFTVRLSEKKINFFYPAGLNYHVEISTPASSL